LFKLNLAWVGLPRIFVVIFNLHISHLLGLEGCIALGAPLLVLGHVPLKPLVDTLGVEEMSTNWNSADLLIGVKTFHADDALGGGILIVGRVEADCLHFGQEHLDVISLLLFDLSLQLLVVALHLLDLPLQPSDVVDSDDVFVPVWVGLVNVEINIMGFVDVASDHPCHHAAA